MRYFAPKSGDLRTLRRTVRLRFRADLVLMMVLFVVGSFPRAADAQGIQHLISPGDHWADLADRLRPGDQIILMPGRHRPAHFDDLQGTANRPITIRGLSRSHPSTIEAQREGIRLRRCQHIEIRDLTITGATVSGIEVVDDAPERVGAEPYESHITIRNVRVLNTGPTGRRHAVRLKGIADVTVKDSHFEAWGGSAVAIIGCHRVTITDCTMVGRENFGQLNAVQARAGSSAVRIENCTIRDAGLTAIALGGVSDPVEFRPALQDEDGSTGSRSLRYELDQVSVRQNLIQGGESAIAFINVSRAIVRHNTILAPSEWVYVVSDEREDPRLGSIDRCQFGSNLITWPAGTLDRLTAVGANGSPRGLTVEENLWWAEPNEDGPKPDPILSEPPAGMLQFQQRVDVDPRLDEKHRPQTPEAQIFGRNAP
ncbi:MAG: right-handed parallel beta-helix repeat-containing protein [Phycisphaerales bacterium]|nr:MAG: right-handed parallel beta-helix repeat-containing protein [Phycisphaerales bacterium]